MACFWCLFWDPRVSVRGRAKGSSIIDRLAIDQQAINTPIIDRLASHNLLSHAAAARGSDITFGAFKMTGGKILGKFPAGHRTTAIKARGRSINMESF